MAISSTLLYLILILGILELIAGALSFVQAFVCIQEWGIARIFIILLGIITIVAGLYTLLVYFGLTSLFGV